MQQAYPVEFKTLLTKAEYVRIYAKFKDNQRDIQTNHYLDTDRFSLKATDTSLRVRERENLELTFKRKKGYNIQELHQEITPEEFKILCESGVLPKGDLANEVQNIIGNQKLENFMSLSTDRICLQYGNGIMYVDKDTYLGFVDFELEYEAKNKFDGKKNIFNYFLI